MKYWYLLIFGSLFCSFSQAQSLQLLNPDGGQVLSGSSNYSITWQYSNVTNIRIELSTDSGSTYQMIAANIAASTLSYNWLIPTIGSTKCFIKITDLSSLISSRSALVFTILPPSISLIYPNGGQQFYAQQGVTIQWQSISVSTLKAEYTVNNGSSWQTIANGIPASNNYLNFTIPSTISSGYRVRLLAESNTALRDSSNTNFSVIGNYAIPNPIKYRGGSFDGYSLRNNLLDSIVIKTPNGGQTLLGASSYSISWAYNNLDNIKIEYSIDSGSTWTNIISNISASTLSYTWIVPSTGSSKCRIKVTDIVSGISDMSDSVFTISPPSISLIYPSGGEQFKAQQGSYINWNSVSVNTVKLEYSSNGSTWQLLAAGVPASNKFYNFTIPNLISNLCRVRVVAESNNAVRDSSHTNFAVTGNFPSPSPTKYRGGSYDGYSMQNNLSDSIRINNPNGGEQLEGGLNYGISWNYNNVEDIKIDYSIDSGNTWSLIVSNISAAKLNFSWLVPTILGGSNRCLIRITDNRTGIFDISDNKFTILAPSISLIFPNGGEQFKSQQGIYINWNSSSVSTVNIDYSANGGTNWINISNNVKASQKYLNWTVPTTIGNNYKVRVTASSTPIVGDTSISFFANIGNYSNPNATKYRGGSYDGYDIFTLVSSGTAPPQVGNIIGQDTICGNSIQTYRVNRVSGENYYLWQIPPHWQLINNQGDSFITVQADTSSGIVSVIVHNIFGSSLSTIKSIYTNLNIPSQPNLIIGDTLLCRNQTSILFKINKVQNSSSYLWEIPPTWTMNVNQTDTFILINSIGYLNGYITVRASNGCNLSSTRTLAVKVDSLPSSVNSIIGNYAPCAGSKQTYITNRVSFANSYLWTIPTGWQIYSKTDTSIIVIVGINSGNISVRTSNYCGVGNPISLPVTISICPPQISIFTPEIGPAGTLVWIKGQNFHSISTFNNIYFGTVKANIIESSDTAIKVIVPLGANYHNISITTLGLTAFSKKPFKLTFNGPINFKKNTFKQKDTIQSTFSNTYYTISSDFNGDGKPDLASTDGWSNYLTINKNSTTGSSIVFDTKINYATGNGPANIISADIDGDGLLDIIVANQSSNSISIFKNTSTLNNISFASKTDFPTGNNPNSLSIGDIDRDGKIDICISTDALNSLTIYKNTSSIGAISLSNRTDFAYGRCNGVKLIDIDGDEKIDIAFALYWTNKISILRNISTSSSFSFDPKIDFSVNSPSSIESGDFDGDGKNDIVVSTYGNSSVSVFKNTSSINSISLANKIDFNTGNEDWGLSLNDMNGDGKVDIVTPNYSPGTISILKNQSSIGTISFANKLDYEIGLYPWNISFADFNLDSFPDLVSSNQTKSYSTYLINNGITIDSNIISGNQTICSGTASSIIEGSIPIAKNNSFSFNWVISTNGPNGTYTLAPGLNNLKDYNPGVLLINSWFRRIVISGIYYDTSQIVMINVIPLPTTPNSILGLNKICKNSSTQYRINRVPNSTNYIWTIPNGWIILSGGLDTFINVTAGVLGGQLTVRASNSCTITQASNLIVQTDSIPSTPSIISGNQTVCGGSTQIYKINSIPNATNYTWSLPNGWTINTGQGDTLLSTIAGNLSGNLIVQAANLCGSSAQRILGIIVSGSLPSQAANIAGNSFPCLGTNHVYTIPRIPFALSYTWSVPNGWTINAGQNDTFINVTVGPNAGNIQVTATNYCGTNIPRILAVNVNTIPSTPTSIIGSNAVCKLGTSVFKTNRVIGATTYNWSLPSGWGFLSTQGDTFVNTSIGSLSGTISVSAGNVCGNSTSFGKSTSLDSVPPIPSTISGNANPCLNASEGYSIGIIPNATSYNWSLPAGWIITSGTSTSAITGTIGSNNGNILVSATNFCGTSSNRTLAATVKTIPPSPASIIGNLAVCKQSSASYKINRIASATSYTWTVPNGWSINNGNGDTIISVTTGNTGGNISVYASNICGNSSATSIIVSVDSIPPQPAIITGNINPCQSSSQAYSISSIANASSYNWIVPLGWSITNGQTSTIMQTNVGSQSGNIQIAAVNFCGTGNYKTLATIVESIPVIPTAIYGNTAVCKSTLQTFTTNRIANASSYTWSIPNGWTIITGLNDTFITVGIGSVSGNISVKANNFCGSSLNKNLFISVDSIPTQPTLISGNLNPCNGSQGTYSASILPNANSYIWTIPASWSINGNQTGSTINVNIGSIDGQITVSGSNMCGVGVAKSSNLVVKNIPLQPSPVNGNTAVCKSSSLTYHIAPVLSASAYLWSVPAGWIINAGQGDTLIRVSIGSISGNVSVIASNNCGSGIARTLFVNVDSIPPIPNIIAGNNAPCANNTLNYSTSKINNANSYNWSLPSGWVINTGQGDTLINTTISKTNGSIMVSATNVCGTSLNRSLTIQVDSNPTITGSITGPAKPCFGIAQNYSIPNVSNATSYLWAVPANWTNNSGQGTTSINVSPSNNIGNITVIASNKCGLSNQKVYTVEYDSIPVQPKLITGNSTPCSNSNYAYSIENISNALNYVWTIPTGWNLINNLESNILVKTNDSGGQISVYAQNSCGIGLSRNLPTDIVTIPSKPILITFEDTLCSGSNYTFKTDSDYFAKNYNWGLPNGYVINSGQGSRIINFTASNISGKIQVMANNGICYGDTNYHDITVTRTPSTPNLISGNFAPCYSTSVTYFTPIDSLSDSYFWKYPMDWNPQGPESSNTINLKTGSQTGKISVQAIKLGCKSSFKEDNLNVQFIPITPTIILGEAYIRSNETRTYLTPTISNAINFNWTLPADWVILSGNGTNEVTTLTGDSSGLIRVNATNVCGTSNSKSLQVYSGVANGISNSYFDDAFGLYPVPSSDFITVEINGNPNDIIEYTIFTLLGQKAQTGNLKMKTQGSEAFQIDISGLKSANYVFELNKGSNKIYKKIVIVR